MTSIGPGNQELLGCSTRTCCTLGAGSCCGNDTGADRKRSSCCLQEIYQIVAQAAKMSNIVDTLSEGRRSTLRGFHQKLTCLPLLPSAQSIHCRHSRWNQPARGGPARHSACGLLLFLRGIEELPASGALQWTARWRSREAHCHRARQKETAGQVWLARRFLSQVSSTVYFLFVKPFPY